MVTAASWRAVTVAAIAPFPTRSELWLAFLEAYELQAGLSVHAGH